MRHAVFGTLTLDDENECWATSIKVPSFAPFRRTPHAKGKPGNTFELCVDVGGDAEQPSQEQVKAFQWFSEHQDAVSAIVLDAIYRYYMRSIKENPRWFEINDCPEIQQPDELRPLLELTGLRVRSDAYRKTALLGFSFDCEWDEEHGLAVLTHKNTIVDIGQAELAYRQPNANASIWLNVCSPKERRAAGAVLNSLCVADREPLEPRIAMLVALTAGDEKQARQLAEQGVDINDVPAGLYHPIFDAIAHGDVTAMKILFALGADLQVDANGTTPLQSAIGTLQAIGNPENMTPGPIRDRVQNLHTRATEVLRLLREAGAK